MLCLTMRHRCGLLAGLHGIVDETKRNGAIEARVIDLGGDVELLSVRGELVGARGGAVAAAGLDGDELRSVPLRGGNAFGVVGRGAGVAAGGGGGCAGGR